MKNQTISQSQPITGNTKQIEGIEFLKGFQGELVEIDYINLDGTCTQSTKFIQDLIIVLSAKYLTLESSTEVIEPIRMLRETIFDIEEEYSHKLIIHTVSRDLIINRI